MDVLDAYIRVSEGLRKNPDLRWGSEQGPGTAGNPCTDMPLTVHVINVVTSDRFTITIERKDS